MRAEILSIGDELLHGATVDTNAAEIARALLRHDIEVERITTVSDRFTDITAAIRSALAAADLLVITGGLGPTKDDITRDGIAAALDRPLELDPASMERIEARFRAVARDMPESNRVQAMIPEGGEALDNDMGTAPGLWVEAGPQIVVALPGVPREMRHLLEDRVLPRLKARGSVGTGYHERLIHAIGRGESHLAESLGDLFRREGEIRVSITVSGGVITLAVRSQGAEIDRLRAEVNDLAEQICGRLGPLVFGRDGETLEDITVALLKQHGRTLAAAESCTGGLLSELVTRIPGSSEVFLGGLVTYANEAKTELLGVPAELIEEHGAVSEPVARAMAEGARQRLRTDLAIGITGVAGPGGGTDEKPVGLVYVACADAEGTKVRECRFPGDRELNRLLAARAALDLVRRHLNKLD
ncbi:MAG: competence/damage-inducible protein A [Planctomycetota bacterium]